jgi:hypothetical protein
MVEGSLRSQLREFFSEDNILDLSFLGRLQYIIDSLYILSDEYLYYLMIVDPRILYLIDNEHVNYEMISSVNCSLKSSQTTEIQNDFYEYVLWRINAGINGIHFNLQNFPNFYFDLKEVAGEMVIKRRMEVAA